MQDLQPISELSQEALKHLQQELVMFSDTLCYQYFLAFCKQGSDGLIREMAGIGLTDLGSILNREKVLGEVDAWGKLQDLFVDMNSEVTNAINK